MLPSSRAGWVIASILVAAMTASLGGHAVEVPFSGIQLIEDASDGASAVLAVDVDGDGDLDTVATAQVADRITWWENTSGAAVAWTEHVVDASFDGARAVTAADLDNDGRVDIAAAGSAADEVGWWRNLGGGSSWTKILVASSFDGATSVWAADIDGDGLCDIVGAASEADDVVWWQNPGDTATPWTVHVIDEEFDGAAAVTAADIDGDGLLDVVAAATLADQVSWWANPGAGATPWIEHVVALAFDGAASVAAADVDGDGQVDIVAAAADDDTVAWWRNQGLGVAWTAHTVDASVAGAAAVTVADFDGDGDADIAGAAATAATVGWWENVSATGLTWVEHQVGAGFDGAASVWVGDLDGDGDPDLVAAAATDDEIAWWRSDPIHHSALLPIINHIDDQFGGAIAVDIADVDGDGDLDAIGAAGVDDAIAWWENVGGVGATWVGHEIDDGHFNEAFAVVSADLDGDGDTDIVAAASIDQTIAWYDNSSGDGSTWVKTVIDAQFNGARGVAVADLDGDGDCDVVGAAYHADDVAWWENLGAGGWTRHVLEQHFDGAAAVAAADLDGDGDTDVVAAARFLGAVWWWENLGEGAFWTVHALASVAGVVGLDVHDLDRDGDLDVVGASATAGTIRWWENDGVGGGWSAHPVPGVLAGVRSVRAADLDRDGDVDLVTAADSADTLAWWENDGGALLWRPHLIDTVFDGASAVAVGDLDRDGMKDVLGAAAAADVVAWWRNRGGQFALQTVDTAPAQIPSGGRDDLLGVSMLHLGRSGDGDAELAILDLLLENIPGSPLTTVEANALVDSLQVWLDEGSPAFDPAEDTLVASVDALTLADGVQTVLLADGDPDVRVEPEQTRDYFVVAEFTDDAHDQTPDRLRITHLTESTSTAEDRDHDIPLQLAYSPQVASGTVVALVAADLSVTMVDAPDPVPAGAELTVTTTVHNDGPGNAAGTTLTEVLPAAVSFTSSSPGPPTCSEVAGTVTCDLGVVAAGASVDVTVFGDVEASASGVLDTTAAVVSAAFDPDSNNDSASEQTVVATVADLAVVVSDLPDPVLAGAALTYSATVTNSGPSDTTAVVLTNTLPVGVSFSWSDPGFPTCAAAINTVTCDLGSQATGNIAAVTITVVVGSTTSGTLTNTAAVTGGGSDPDPANNTYLEDTLVVESADIEVSIADWPDPVMAGETLSYTIDVRNLGGFATTGVTVTDALAPEVTFVASIPGAPTCLTSAGVVSCALGTLAPGASSGVEIVVIVDSGTSGGVTNTATAGADLGDPVPANNLDTETTVVMPDTVFSDGFETGDTSAWSMTVGRARPS